MKGIQWLVLICLMGAFVQFPALAQQKSNLSDLVTPGANQEIFEPRYISSKSFERMMQALAIRFDSFKEVDSKIFVRFSSPADAERARTLLQRIDEPPRRISIAIKLVQASEAPVSDGALKDQKVLDQLQKVFRFKGYRLLSEGLVTLNSREDGEIGLQGASMDGNRREHYVAQFEPIFIDDGKGVIKLEELEIERDNDDASDVKVLETTLNIKNGETVIVGSSNVEGRVYITIVTAMVLE